MRDKYKIAIIRFQHETCTFCPGGDTDIEDWLRIKPVLSDDEVLISGPYGNYIRGFVDMANEYEDIEVIGISSPYEVYGGISRSWITTGCFNYFMDIILSHLKSKLPVDAVYLALHGAMAVRNIPRPEAEIAKRIRNLVGVNIPIAATFDLHGNEDEEFLKWADGAFTVKRYPHYDTYLQGERAARFLRLVLTGKYKPVHATRKPPIITATVLQWTGISPSMNIMEKARQWEDTERDVYVNVFYGYPWADTIDGGITVQVITNNNQKLADLIADDMSSFIWGVRKEFTSGNFPSPKKSIMEAKAAIEKHKTPVVVADFSDRSGDATWVLKELIRQEVHNYLIAPLRDENALEFLVKNRMKPGDHFDMKIGASTAEIHAGSAVRISGSLRFLGRKWEYENVAVVETNNRGLIIITPTYKEFKFLEEIDFSFIRPEELNIIVLKSRVHFRRGFVETGFAKTVIFSDSPGKWVGSMHLDRLDYRNTPIKELYPYAKTGHLY